MPIRPSRRQKAYRVPRQFKHMRITVSVKQAVWAKGRLDFVACARVGAVKASPGQVWPHNKTTSCGAPAASPRRAIGNALRKLGASLGKRKSAFASRHRRRR